MSSKLELAIWLCDTGQRILFIDRCQLIDHNMDVQSQAACLSQPYLLGFGRHVARLLRRRRAYAPTSNTTSHYNHEKINSWVSFSSLYGYGAPLGGPSGSRSSAMK